MLEIFQMKGKLLGCKYNSHSSLLATRAVSWGEIVKCSFCGAEQGEKREGCIHRLECHRLNIRSQYFPPVLYTVETS